MDGIIDLVNNLLALFTIIGGVVVITMGTLLIVRKKSDSYKNLKSVFNLLEANALTASFIVASLSTLGSLFYSEVANYTPCKLCWIQRIFMYPQMILLGIATVKNDKSIASYLLPLNIIGGLFSAYHYNLQINPNAVAPCTTVGYSLGCSERFVLQYGYITIPMMALTAFTMITLFLVLVRRSK